MHEAYIKINNADRVLIYRASGHTGYAPAGSDPVCAAASMLAAMIADTVTAAYQAGWVGDTAIVELTAEKSEVSCIADDGDVFGELARRYAFIADGYRRLAFHYPDYVKFTDDIKV